MEGSTEPLALGVSLWVMWCGVCFLYSVELAELSNDSTFELSTLVGMQALRHSIYQKNFPLAGYVLLFSAFLSWVANA